MTTQTQEKYLNAKELVSALLDQHGLVVSQQFVRSMLRAGVPRLGFSARLSDVMAWWQKHPNFSPRGKRTRAFA